MDIRKVSPSARLTLAHGDERVTPQPSARKGQRAHGAIAAAGGEANGMMMHWSGELSACRRWHALTQLKPERAGAGYRERG